MATVSHPSPAPPPQGREWPSRVLVSEASASMAIGVMWLAVLFDALFGPDLVFNGDSGAGTTRIPSAVVVAIFAYLATRVLARYAFGRRRDAD